MDQPQNLRIGQLGENIACVYLQKWGYRVIERNYKKKWGEIDVVATKGEMLYFVEVKSVSREIVSKSTLPQAPRNDEYDASDNMHPWKRKRLSRVIQTYLLDRFKDDDEPDWQLDLLCVYIDERKRQARVERYEDVDL